MDNSEFKKFTNQFWVGLLIAFISIMGTTIILANINSTEIDNVKMKNIDQDRQLEKLQDNSLSRDEFIRLFEVLDKKIDEIKSDLKTKNKGD